MHAAVSLAKQAAGLMQDGEFLLAIERFWQSQAITPSPLALYGISYCYLALKDFSKVVNTSQEALKTSSLFDDKLKILLAKAYEGLGDYYQSKTTWESLESSTKDQSLLSYSKINQSRLSEILKNNEEYLKVLRKSYDHTEQIFIISQTWIIDWKNFLLNNEQHPGPIKNQNLIEKFIDDPRDYASTVLKQALIEGEDYCILNTLSYKLLKDQYGSDIDIKRFCTVDKEIKHVEIRLESLNLQLCPKVSEKFIEVFEFPYSSKETIQEIISACKSLIGPSFDHVGFNFDVFRIWNIGKNTKIDLSLSKIFIPSAELVNSFPPVYASGDVFLFEFQKSDGNWTVYSQLESPCPYCNVLSELSTLCPNCKTIKYCSPGCLDLHKFVHLPDCTQLLDRNGKTGLRNLGNTCYMNSIIQCLSHTSLLSLYFLNKMYLHENTVNGILTLSFARLVFQLWGVNCGIVFPSEFKRAFCQKFKQFEGIAQQDSHEFLIQFLDGINDEMKNGDNLTVVGRNFFGQVSNELTCLKCSYKAEKQEDFLTLSLPVINLEKVQITVYMVFANLQKPVIRRVLGSYFSWKSEGLKEIMEKEFGCEIIMAYYDMQQFRGFVVGGDIGEYVGKVLVGFEKNKGIPVVCSIKGVMGKLTFDRIFFLDFENFEEVVRILKAKISEIFDVSEEFLQVCVFNNEKIVENFEQLEGFDLKAVVEIVDGKVPGFLHFHDLGILNIDIPVSFDISSSLRLLTEGETLDEGNKWHCANCNIKNPAKKCTKITKFPKILVFQLMKFKNSLGKLETFVDFPLEDLDLSEFGTDSKYDLYAVCNHFGTHLFGHYTAYVKSEGAWYDMDDSFVNSIASGRVVSTNAYLLFYIRK